jgi:hypothetical protein
MATVSETQAYLAEAKIPSVVATVAVRGATKLYATTVGDMERQAALFAQLLQSAEIAEPDDALRGRFEEGFQKLGALVRQANEIERQMREVVRTYREFKDWDTRLRELAGSLGYTV